MNHQYRVVAGVALDHFAKCKAHIKLGDVNGALWLTRIGLLVAVVEDSFNRFAAPTCLVTVLRRVNMSCSAVCAARRRWSRSRI